MKITKRKLFEVMRALQWVGYYNLTPYEQLICDAFDRGTIQIVEGTKQ